MRELLVGAALLVSALIVTLATASLLQGLAVAKHPIVAEPVAIERATPATATRTPRSEPAGRSLVLSRHAQL